VSYPSLALHSPATAPSLEESRSIIPCASTEVVTGVVPSLAPALEYVCCLATGETMARLRMTQLFQTSRRSHGLLWSLPGIVDFARVCCGQRLASRP